MFIVIAHKLWTYAECGCTKNADVECTCSMCNTDDLAIRIALYTRILIIGLPIQCLMLKRPRITEFVLDKCASRNELSVAYN